MRHLSAVVESVKSELVQWPLRISSGQIKSFFDSTVSVSGGVDSFCLQRDVALFFGQKQKNPSCTGHGHSFPPCFFCMRKHRQQGLDECCKYVLQHSKKWRSGYSSTRFRQIGNAFWNLKLLKKVQRLFATRRKFGLGFVQTCSFIHQTDSCIGMHRGHWQKQFL